MEKEHDITFKGFWKILLSRFKYPKNNPGFWFYFIIVIVIVSGLGFWIHLLRGESEQFMLNSCTYFIAIVTTSTITISLKGVKALGHYENSFQLFLISLGVVGAILIAIVVFNDSNLAIRFVFSVLCIIIAWISWWLINSDNKDILGGTPNVSDITEEKKPISGNLGNVKH